MFDEAAEIGYSFSLLDIGGGYPGYSGGEVEFDDVSTSVESALCSKSNDLTSHFE